jgi:hypothetical protein
MKLYKVLIAYLDGKELAEGPMDNLVIPLKNGDSLLVPILLLKEANATTY